jgi:hypothetical protein
MVRIVQGANVMSPVIVNNRVSADGTVYSQSFPVGGGIPFGAELPFCDLTVLLAILAAVQAAVDLQLSFAVVLTDDFQTVDVQALPASSDWITWEPQRTNPLTVKGVKMQFITAGE